MPSLREMLAEQRKQEAERLKNEAATKAAAEAKAVFVPVATKHVYTPRAPADEPEIEATAGGYVPSTDALRVAAKMLTGKTVRGSGADARRAIAQWNGKIPKARKQH